MNLSSKYQIIITCNGSFVECVIQLLEEFSIGLFISRQNDRSHRINICLLQARFYAIYNSMTKNIGCFLQKKKWNLILT